MYQDEPTSYQDAMLSLDSEKWQRAMKSEMQSMFGNPCLIIKFGP